MKGAFALLLLLPLAVAVAQAPETWPIDPARSQVQFSVRKFWITRARGTLPQLQGTLRRIDTGQGDGFVEVDATVDVVKLQMDDADDREHALGADFFDAARYPWIRFASGPIPSGELVAGGTVTGELTLHGERHPVTLRLQPSACPGRPLGCVIRVRGSISRSRFGMRSLRGVLSDKVELDLSISVTLPKPGP
ncbi:MAG: YceI family protein [Rhodanobacteraceae bacterium]